MCGYLLTISSFGPIMALAYLPTAHLPLIPGKAFNFCSECGTKFQASAKFCHASWRNLRGGEGRIFDLQKARNSRIVYSYMLYTLYTNVCMYAYNIYIYRYFYLHVYLNLYLQMHTHVFIYMYMYTYIYIYMCIYVYIYMCVYINIFIYIYMYIYICV